MHLRFPSLHISYKIYPNTAGEDGIEFARLIQKVRDETGAELFVTPQILDIRMVAENTDLTVTAPRVDAVETGRGTGRVLPETLKRAGAEGVMMNHPEDRDLLVDLDFKINRCREIGIDSIVCIDSLEMAEAVAYLDPDAFICEKPGNIGGDHSVVADHPEYVKNFISVVKEVNPDSKVLVGSGMGSPEDVRRAFELGADAIGAASTFCLANDREQTLRMVAEAMPK